MASRLLWIVAGALALAATASAPRVVSAALASPPEARGVTSYPANFFADARPDTAFDMIARLPGFTFDPGVEARGFAAAGRSPNRTRSTQS